MRELDRALAACRARVAAALERLLPPATRPPVRLHEAMRYATLDGGKRIRAFLVYETGALFGVAPETLDVPAAALELIHAYSLVHDDLPAMDDDHLRRGRPTCHVRFGEAEAILAGDALQTLAFEALAGAPLPGVSPAHRLEMIHVLARAAGSRGMAGGQSLDLAAEGRELDVAELEYLHILKTGALIRAAVRLGLLCAPAAGAAERTALDRYAERIGLAFQIQDDILDVRGETAALGKQAGADAARDKATYPALLGLEEAERRARELVAEANRALAPFGDRADLLRRLATYIVTRTA
ncbi:MAG: (2E,6E)-farnesyl diphosphate synthase [Gammaproteobacteria bacterium]|nr:MAG: (2E,6E)-farnesyl diphosphate synthase [Gammaproteobacteria bacterium]